MREDVDGSELGGPELADADPGSQLRGASLSRLVSIMQRLLGPSGCPWDREQTVSSLRPYVLEEAFEVVDAVDRGEPDAIREELGDLLFQVVFMAELAAKQGWFATDEVI
ncbi:MAG: MazG nucleotide pyrophosphohydrolase domain-containing protein, partial [Myxococcota bacterium]